MRRRKAFLLQTCNLQTQAPLEPGLLKLMLTVTVVTLCHLGEPNRLSIGIHGDSPGTGHPGTMMMGFRIVKERFSKQARSEDVQESMLSITTM